MESPKHPHIWLYADADRHISDYRLIDGLCRHMHNLWNATGGGHQRIQDISATFEQLMNISPQTMAWVENDWSRP